jgi:hypothetical protein
MFVERTALAYPQREGEVIFFSGRKDTPRLPGVMLLQNPNSTARMRLMDQAVEKIEIPTPEVDVAEKTIQAEKELYLKSIFQNNGLLAGTSGRLLRQQDELPQAPSSTTSDNIAKTTVNEFYQYSVKGDVLPLSEHYEGDLYKAYMMANQRQSNGSLQTGHQEFDAEIGNWFNMLNGQLFRTNRIDDPSKIGLEETFKSMSLAMRLNEAFPERASKIDVYDVSLRQGGFRQGQMLKLAAAFLEKAAQGVLYQSDHKKIPVRPKDESNMAKARMTYQSDGCTSEEYSLGSNALAAVMALRFMGEFHPQAVQDIAVDWRVLDQAKKDLQKFSDQPGVYQDPNLVMLMGEHISNLRAAEKLKNLSQPENISQFRQPTA